MVVCQCGTGSDVNGAHQYKRGMMSSTVAIVLNFVLPGVGLCYLGQPRRGAFNFLIACVGAMVSFFLMNDYCHYVLLAIAAGSAGYAHAMSRVVRESDHLQR